MGYQISGMCLLCLIVFTVGSVNAQETKNLFDDEKIRLVIRVDDIGFTHDANMAMKKLAEEGHVTAASVMVTTPWLDEAVEVLKEHPEVSVGLHTTLNCEWTPYRWGPVSCPHEVPTLVDEWGKFFGSRKQLMDNKPNVDEVEKEIRAQLELALKKGLKLSYMDHHMSAAVETPEMKKRFVKVAEEYGLGISRWYGEKEAFKIYEVEPEKKADWLVSQVRALKEPGLYIVVGHPGMNTPELAVLKDVHPWAPKNMAEHRKAELEALCDPRFDEVLKEKGIELIGYDVLKEKFPDAIRTKAAQ